MEEEQSNTDSPLETRSRLAPLSIPIPTQKHHRPIQKPTFRSSWWHMPLENVLEVFSPNPATSSMPQERSFSITSSAVDLTEEPDHHASRAIATDGCTSEEEDEEEDCNRQSAFWAPEPHDVITQQPLPTQVPEIPDWVDLDEPSQYEKRTVPNKKTKNLTVLQTGLFYFFSCSSCRGISSRNELKEMAKHANEKFKHFWTSEIENKPTSMKRRGDIIDVEGTKKSSPEANGVHPSTVVPGGVHPDILMGVEGVMEITNLPVKKEKKQRQKVIKAEEKKGKQVVKEQKKEVKKEHKEQKKEGKQEYEWLKLRVKRTHDMAPVITGFGNNLKVKFDDNVEEKDLGWMKVSPPPAVWKNPTEKAPRLAHFGDDTDTMYVSSRSRAIVIPHESLLRNPPPRTWKYHLNDINHNRTTRRRRKGPLQRTTNPQTTPTTRRHRILEIATSHRHTLQRLPPHLHHQYYDPAPPSTAKARLVSLPTVTKLTLFATKTSYNSSVSYITCTTTQLVQSR